MSLHVQNQRTRRRAVGAATAILAFGLVGCGASDDAESADAAESASGSVASLSITDPWVKSADEGMTAAFGTLVNDGAEDVVVTAVSSEVSPTMELHETVGDAGAMQMQEKEGGFVVPAGGELELAPGGNHLMLMDLQQQLRPGETVAFTLDVEGADPMTFDAVAKSFSGADEEYVEGSETGEEMDMGGGDDE